MSRSVGAGGALVLAISLWACGGAKGPSSAGDNKTAAYVEPFSGQQNSFTERMYAIRQAGLTDACEGQEIRACAKKASAEIDHWWQTPDPFAIVYLACIESRDLATCDLAFDAFAQAGDIEEFALYPGTAELDPPPSRRADPLSIAIEIRGFECIQLHDRNACFRSTWEAECSAGDRKSCTYAKVQAERAVQVAAYEERSGKRVDAENAEYAQREKAEAEAAAANAASARAEAQRDAERQSRPDYLTRDQCGYALERACQYLEVQNRNRGAPEDKNAEWLTECLGNNASHVAACMRIPCGKRFYNCLVNTFDTEKCEQIAQTCKS